MALIDAYDDSNNKDFQDRGLKLVEQYLGITHNDTGPVTEGINPTKEKALGLLFNFYFRFDHADWVEIIATSAQDNGIETPLVLRNLARAYADQGKEELAKKMYQYAMDKNPSDDTTYVLYGDYLDNLGKYEEAFEYTENGIIADPQDGSRYINLAIQILNRGYVRGSNGELTGPVSKEIRLRHALPYFKKAMEISGTRYINQVTSVLVRADAVELARKIVEGQSIDESLTNDSYDVTKKKVENNSITRP